MSGQAIEPDLENGTKTGRGTETMVKITPQNQVSEETVAAAALWMLLTASTVSKIWMLFLSFLLPEFTNSLLYWILPKTSASFKSI